MNYIYNRNTDSKGNHEVHTVECDYLPKIENRIEIRYDHTGCRSAIAQAKEDASKTNFDGCYYCSRPCHKG